MDPSDDPDPNDEYIVIDEKSKWFAALSNFLIPGLGYFYLDRGTDHFETRERGWITIGIWLLGLLTSIIGIGVLIVVGLMIYVVYDCFTRLESTQIAARARLAQAGGQRSQTA